MSEADGYEAWNPRRLCDTCGELYRLSQLRRLPGNVWSCNVLCAGERTATELSQANASQKPFLYRPVRNAKPENPFNPDTFEADDGTILNFIARMVTAGTRFESVASGDPAPLSGHAIEGLSWSAAYLYGIISDNTRSASFIARCRLLLGQCATRLLARQYGSATGPSPASTIATEPFFGAFLEPGASNFVTNDTATSGLALLYAYRVLGTQAYLEGARAAASFLRNVQAIGSNGVFFTSSDSAGTARLYTGSLLSETKRVFDVDLGFIIYGNHLFYPSALLALQLWNELKTTDGDQMIGMTGTGLGSFSTAPTKLMSACMSDLRACWTNGITGSTQTLVNGFSATTPREFFNAYPASKPQFAVVGSGLWEFFDGASATGTQITAQNYALALSSLYAYEGATSQVAAIDDWLRSFTSNADFETPSNISDATLARSTTGTYDATNCLATLLTVRDSDNSYAAIKTNGSSLYDWGAFGLLSPLWASRHTGTFAESRRSACGENFRFFDRRDTDDDYKDWIKLRGLSGLTYQTAFSTDGNNAAGATPFALTSASTLTPPTEGLVFWVKGSTGVTLTTGKVTAWQDQGLLHQDLTVTPANKPVTGVDTANGLACVSFPVGSQASYIASSTTMKDRNGNAFTAAKQRTVVAILKPQASSAGFGFNITGGPVFSFREQPCFECLFDLEAFFHPTGGFYVFANIWRFGGEEISGPDTIASTYANQTVVCEWSGASSTGSTVSVAVNGSTIRTTPATSLGSAGAGPPAGFLIGNCDNNTGTPNNANFQGGIEEVLIYDWIVTGATLTQLRQYTAQRSGLSQGVSLGVTNDVVRAAMFGIALRQNPRSTTAPVH